VRVAFPEPLLLPSHFGYSSYFGVAGELQRFAFVSQVFLIRFGGTLNRL